MKRLIFLITSALTLFFLPLKGSAQEGSLLDILGKDEVTDYTTNAFKSSRVINGHSMEMISEGTLDFRILHRFGRISDGFYEMFGLDRASMRIGFDYGISPNLMVGFGRSTAKKEMDAFVKYRILWQSKGSKNNPVSLVWVSGITMNGLKDPIGNPEVPVTLSRRLGYYHELIIGRKITDRLTLQLSPTWVHRNIVDNQLIPNELFAVGFGGRVKFTQRLAFVWDYGYVINRFPGNLLANPLSIGLDIETGGHVFQLHFSNAVGMNERAYLSDTNGDWLKGDIQFGFNLSRIFQVKKRPIE
ncbi:MAG: DUF5777 family beta-barrel protein [Saprospiraceae bacterium]|nr:DUF5777 family beta-barrel protein [Saprospiraceae bacterium]MDZ4706652.1 DUF5777 family beta-barrel protein [Saprospiraceae bacterium]